METRSSQPGSPEIDATPMSPTAPDHALQSGLLTSLAEPLLGRAIASALAAPPAERRSLFARRVEEIVRFMAEHPEERPWTCTVYAGTDGSAIFRGGVGHSLVIDPSGRIWRARSYEDFRDHVSLRRRHL